jgi:hypothetical protein
MKKQILFAAAMLISASMIITGCKKDDTTPPTITLTGGAVSQNISDTYSEPGYSANDAEDGNITSSVAVTGTVSNGLVGVYTLKYNVSDAAGNEATEETRTVTVKSDELAGLYDVSDVVTSNVPGNAGTYSENPTVTQSTTAYNKILIANFAGLGTPVIVNATVNGTAIVIPAQMPSGMQNPGTISGTGTVSGKNIVSITYHIAYTTPAGGYDDGVQTFSNHQ